MFEFTVVTSHDFSQAEFTKFVADMGAKLEEFGRFFIPGQTGYIYAGLDESELKNLLKDKEQKEIISEKLGREPKSVIVVSIGQIGLEASQQLALTFALQVARRWGAVVDNLQPDEDHHVYTLPELADMEQREGRWSD